MPGGRDGSTSGQDGSGRNGGEIMVASLAAAREILAVSALLFAMVLLLGAVVLLYRRRYLGRRSDPAEGFTLADVRRMYKEGQVSKEEYERIRQTLLGGVIKETNRPGPTEGLGQTRCSSSHEGKDL